MDTHGITLLWSICVMACQSSSVMKSSVISVTLLAWAHHHQYRLCCETTSRRLHALNWEALKNPNKTKRLNENFQLLNWLIWYWTLWNAFQRRAPPTINWGIRLCVNKGVILSHYLTAKMTFHNASQKDTEFATHHLEANWGSEMACESTKCSRNLKKLKIRQIQNSWECNTMYTL